MNTEMFRNVVIPLAATKANLLKKGLIVGLIVLYLISVIYYFTYGILVNYMGIEIGLIVGFLLLVSFLFDVIYRCICEVIIDGSEAGIVIGFSNKLLILMGDEVVEELETDEIFVRKIVKDEKDMFFTRHTSIVECKKNGEIVGRVAIDKTPELEGVILKPDNSRADEDMQVDYYDDTDDEDM